MKLIKLSNGEVLGINLATWGDKDKRGEYNINLYPDKLQQNKCQRLINGGYCIWYPWILRWWFSRGGKLGLERNTFKEADYLISDLIHSYEDKRNSRNSQDVSSR